jgi:serine/threonine protein kinase
VSPCGAYMGMRMSLYMFQPVADVILCMLQDLIRRLLNKDPKARLGHGGASELKNHAFFIGVCWESLPKSESSSGQFKVLIEEILSFDASFAVLHSPNLGFEHPTMCPRVRD